MDIDAAWRDALLAASRTLRQSVLKGRIWGDASSSPPGDARSPPPRYDSYSSASSVELTDEDGDGDVAVRRRRKVRGRVLGMVRSFERSGSFSSVSDMDEDADQQQHATIKPWLTDGPAPEAAVLSPSSETLVEAGSPSQLSESHTGPEEPTMEALLAQTESEPKGSKSKERSWGARAWEAFDVEPGVTVKRVASDPAADDLPEHDMSEAHTRDSAKLPPIARRSAMRQKERRVVTAVFAPSVDGERGLEPEDVSSTSCLAQEQAIRAARDMEEQTAMMLQAELTETRALVDAFRRRLEIVESKMDELEKAEVMRQQELARSCTTAEVQTSHVESPSPSTTESPLKIPLNTFVPLSPTSLLAFGSSLLPSAVRKAIPESLVPSRSRPRRNSRLGASSREPSSISELPQYMLLVGIGVCVVVLRVVLKKAVRRL
jgi:hypothetical protein